MQVFASRHIVPLPRVSHGDDDDGTKMIEKRFESREILYEKKSQSVPLPNELIGHTATIRMKREFLNLIDISVNTIFHLIE